MKNSIFLSLLLGFVLLQLTNVQCQTIYKKAYFDNTELKLSPVINLHSPNSYLYFYFDEENRLRRFSDYVSYPESLDYLVAYYDTAGNLLSIIYSGVDLDYSANFSLEKIGERIFFDSKIKGEVTFDGDKNENKIEHELGYLDNLPDSMCSIKLSSFHTANTLLNEFKIKKADIPQLSEKLSFERPKKGDVSYINANSVNGRSGASSSSKVLKVINAGQIIKITDVLHSEEIKDLGYHSWYKVLFQNTELYIFGAFIDDVEKNIDTTAKTYAIPWEHAF